MGLLNPHFNKLLKYFLWSSKSGIISTSLLFLSPEMISLSPFDSSLLVIVSLHISIQSLFCLSSHICIFGAGTLCFHFGGQISLPHFLPNPLGLEYLPPKLWECEEVLSRGLARITWIGRILETVDAQSKKIEGERGRSRTCARRAQVYRTGWKHKVVVNDIIWMAQWRADAPLKQ